MTKDTKDFIGMRPPEYYKSLFNRWLGSAVSDRGYYGHNVFCDPHSKYACKISLETRPPSLADRFHSPQVITLVFATKEQMKTAFRIVATELRRREGLE